MKNVYAQSGSAMKLMLAGGIASAPLFFAVSIIQTFTRTGFDIRRHAISNLTLGELGWIQSVNFMITGLLAILAALGIRSALRGGKGGAWGPLFIGIYGLGMIIAGIFRPDPGMSFPPGAPTDMPASMSSEAALHSMAFFTAFICLVAASFVIARRFAAQGDRGFRTYSLATGIIAPLLIMVGMSMNTWIGVIMGIAGMVAFGWVSALAARLHKLA
ncbi:DUF998 domain-containing protein [Paenibacillus guangzhouensis]|uniref:DUF998 domain-containing protein n=1 Tax=Paenibacillus guangzhouensis TaxID=1473112 RepID=UPI0012668B13|nr:DUF998 domain-containing protein [Paenibacillus guangzhouensis]